MQTFILSMINQFGYLAIFLLITLETIFPPIPSEIILGFGGFLSTYSQLSFIGVVSSATLGSVLGAMILYGIGKIFHKEKLLEITNSKLGKAIHLKKEDIQKADAWFDQYGNFAVFIGRFIPIVRSFISIPAGMSDMPIIAFLFYTIMGSSIWNVALTYLGSLLGEHWEFIIQGLKNYTIILLLLFFFILFLCMIFWRKKRRKK